MTSSYHQNRTRLFLPVKGNQDISKDSVSRWISYTIKLAYRKLTKRDISFLKIKAHEVRALSSSWAFFDKVPLNEILQAAVWSRSSAFARFYLRDMSQQAENLQSLSPIVVAQKVVGANKIQSRKLKHHWQPPNSATYVIKVINIHCFMLYLDLLLRYIFSKGFL